jgi:ABC-type amino acid transport substrate-binding protein
MKRWTLLSTLIAGILSTSVWAGNFTVGVEGTDYMPIAKGDGAAYSGYAKDLLDAFAAKSGHTFTYKPMPVARLWDEFLVQKSLDFKFPDNGYWNGDAKKGIKVTYSSGLVAVTEGLLVAPASKGKGSVSKIVTLRGFTPFPYLDQIKDKKVALTEVNSADAAINMVEAGRVDGVYLGVLAGNYIMAEVMKKPGVLVYDDKLPNSKNDFSLSTISRPEVIAQMNEFLSKEKDTVAKLKAKYKITE